MSNDQNSHANRDNKDLASKVIVLVVALKVVASVHNNKRAAVVRDKIVVDNVMVDHDVMISVADLVAVANKDLAVAEIVSRDQQANRLTIRLPL